MPSQSQTSLWLFPAVFAAMMGCLWAYQFDVGGTQGWTPNPSENYNHWAERMRFQVNDTLFFKYKKGTDSVLVVRKEDYDNCSSGNPIVKMDGGDSVFKYDRSGPFYFITGNKDNCQKGQKLITIVLAVGQKSTPPPPPGSPTPAVSPSPAPTTAPTPSPTPSPGPAAVSPSPAPTTAPTPSPTPSPAPAVSPSPAPTALSPSPTPSPTPAAPTPAPVITPAASPSPTPNGPPSPPSSSPPAPSTPGIPPPSPAGTTTQPQPPPGTPANDNSTSPPGSSPPVFTTNPSVLALIIIMATVTLAL